MFYKETVVRGSVASHHLVQLFDSRDSLADTVADFVAQGLQGGEAVLIVAVPAHWNAIAVRLDALGLSAERFRASGRITTVDARELLDRCMSDGLPQRGLFHQSVGSLVRDLGSRGTGVRIYGEMVNLLAEEGDFPAARQLEDLWNELGEEQSFTLLCGYSAVHFGDPRSAAALHSICGAHSHVRAHVRDILGNFLVDSYTRQGQPPPASSR